MQNQERLFGMLRNNSKKKNNLTILTMFLYSKLDWNLIYSCCMGEPQPLKFISKKDSVFREEKEVLPSVSFKEAVDFVFDQNPELAEIGTQEEYMQFLETIFPNSLLQNPVYHETKSDWFKTEKFSKEKIGQTDAGYYGKGFYFSTQPGISGGYGHNEFLSVLNVKNPKYHIDTHTVGKQILSGLTKQESRNIAVSWLEKQIQHYEKELEDLKNGFIRKHNDIPKDVDFETYWENKRIETIQNVSNLSQEYKGQLKNIDTIINEYYSHDGFLTSDNLANYEEILIREEDQIHVLGSNEDVKKFGEFIEREKIRS